MLDVALEPGVGAQHGHPPVRALAARLEVAQPRPAVGGQHEPAPEIGREQARHAVGGGSARIEIVTGSCATAGTIALHHTMPSLPARAAPSPTAARAAARSAPSA
jgi:hypothetical protein